MNRSYTLIGLAMVTCLPATIYGSGFGNWPANSGGFSYSFVNLSGADCNLSAFGGNPNPATGNSTSGNSGWNNGYAYYDSTYSAKTYTIIPGFFICDLADNMKAPTLAVFFGGCSPLQNQQWYNLTGASADPAGWAVGKTGASYIYPGSGPNPVSLANGQNISLIEPAAAMGGQPNPATVGDSWVIQCNPDSSANPGQSVVMANLASAGDSLGSGLLNDAYDYFASNALLNPPAPGNLGPFSSANPPSGNVNGMSLVTSENNVINLNQSSSSADYQPTGGLWLGIQNPNANTAAYTLIPALFPVNLAAYTVALQESNNGNTQYQTDIYGGHLTFVIGDPFIVSGIAAKTLWFLATGQGGFSLNDNSFNADAPTNGIQSFLNAINGGLFPANSYALNYVNTLMQSTAQAGFVVNRAIQAATVTTSHESFWGKLFTALFNVGMTAINDATAVYTAGAVSKPVSWAIRTAVDTTTGSLGNPVDNAITNAFTTTTSTQPATQNAPLAFNPSFASSNLLGLLLTNAYVQYQVYAGTGNTPSLSPLWSNYTIQTADANSNGSCDSIQVTNNLFQADVECFNGSGYVAQSQINPAPAYSNVCENHGNGACANAGSGSDSQLNVWTAILTGSDVAANGSGELVVQNPATWSFQPPTQIADPSIGSIMTNFNLNTGALTMTSYTPVTPAPSSTPTINPQAGYNTGCGAENSASYAAANVSYDATTGLLTVGGYSYGCPGNPFLYGGEDNLPLATPATLDMTTCSPGSTVNMAINGYSYVTTIYFGPYENTTQIPNMALECANPATVTTSVVLNYSQCVNDPNASGAVVGMNIGNSPGLACVCLPAYLSGQSGGLVTGLYATAASTTQGAVCPSGG